MRWGKYHIRDERCAANDREWRKIAKLHEIAEDQRPQFADAVRIYRQLKLNYQESGHYQAAGEFFVREMECKRAQMVVARKSLWSRFGQALMYFVCGYGERPGWIVACIMALILVFAGFHTWAGVADLKAGDEVNAATPNGVVHSFWTALYFSVITFTSLGYADLAPVPGIGRALAGLEAVLGIVLMSLFLICIVRKFSR